MRQRNLDEQARHESERTRLASFFGFDGKRFFNETIWQYGLGSVCGGMGRRTGRHSQGLPTPSDLVNRPRPTFATRAAQMVTGWP
jgi:hypothetical protein